jgi:hypothetical protein
MGHDKLLDELVKLQDAILAHREVGNKPRTVEDDRQLYRVLPEKLPADFRLPPKEDFLGEAKAPTAGCPSFWRSHFGCSGCGECAQKASDLHKWGPCKPKSVA